MDRLKLTDFCNVASAAQELNVSHMAIHYWAKRGQIQLIELDGHLFVPRSEIERIRKERSLEPGVDDARSMD